MNDNKWIVVLLVLAIIPAAYCFVWWMFYILVTALMDTNSPVLISFAFTFLFAIFMGALGGSK